MSTHTSAHLGEDATWNIAPLGEARISGEPAWHLDFLCEGTHLDVTVFGTRRQFEQLRDFLNAELATE